MSAAIRLVAIVLTGVVAGVVGNVTGIASVVSYPALLALGLPPIVANATNSVTNVFGGLGAVAASRRELTGQRRTVWRLSVATLAGGTLGAILLLSISAVAFARLVPWLIALASLAILIPVRRNLVPGLSHGLWLFAALFVVGVYGGFFGAAAGVLATALLLHARGDTLARTVALRVVLLCVSNFVAAVLFSVRGVVDWSVVAPLAAGFFAGGTVGPRVVRKAPVWPLKIVIAIVGMGLAAHLALDAY